MTEPLQRSEDDSRPSSWVRAEAALGLAAFEADLRSGHVSCTARFAELHGIDPAAAVTYESALASVHPDDRARWVADQERLRREPGPYTTEFRVVDAAGVRRLLATGAVLADADGTADRIVGIIVERSRKAVVEEAELSFRACFEQAPVGVARVRADGRIAFANATLARLLGGPIPEHVEALFATLPEENRDALHAIATGARHSVRLKAQLATSGEEVWAEVSAAHIDPGFPGGYGILIFQDVTEQRRVSRRLAASENRFRFALSNAPTTVFEQDRDLRYVWIFNPHLDMSAEDVVGRTDADFMDAPSAARVVALKRRAMSARTAVREIVEVRTAEGGAGTYDLFVEPIIEPGSSEVTGVACAATDVTAAAHREAELASEKERFRTSVESLLDCLGVYTAVRDESGRVLDFRIDYVNDAACVANGMTREAQIGRGLCEILPGHRSSGLFDDYVALVETGAPLRRESLFYSDENSGRKLIRAFDISAAKLRDGFVAVWRDVTDRKRLEVELADALADRDRLLDQQTTLLRELDHRVKNNFQLLANLLSLQGSSAPEAVRTHLADARQRLMTIAAVHEVLRVEPDQVETVSLRAALSELCGALRSSVGPQIALDLDAPDLEVLTSHAVTLCMIVNESATNALKYAFAGRESGRLTIRAAVVDDSLHLAVADDGVGYDPRSSRQGLGTKLLERLASTLGGEPRVVSDASGTRITLALPLRGLVRRTEDAPAGDGLR